MYMWLLLQYILYHILYITYYIKLSWVISLLISWIWHNKLSGWSLHVATATTRCAPRGSLSLWSCCNGCRPVSMRKARSPAWWSPKPFSTGWDVCRTAVGGRSRDSGVWGELSKVHESGLLRENGWCTMSSPAEVFFLRCPKCFAPKNSEKSNVETLNFCAGKSNMDSGEG